MKMKNKKIGLLIGIMAVSVIALGGCTLLESFGKNFKESFKGLTVEIRTYDVNSQVIDRVQGQSISMDRDTRFDSTDSDGSSNKDSKVLNITVGGKEMIHVGSSLVAAEKGLVDEFEVFSKKVDIENFDRSIPILNRMANGFKNQWSPTSKVVLIRSQQGVPLATYVGDKVAVEKTDIPSSTSLLVDGKRLFVYRCDYTIYELGLLDSQE